MTARARILIADDHTLFREGVCALLKTVDKYDIVGEVDNGKDAILKSGELNPDLLICDISMPHTNGTEAIQRIKSRYPKIRILVLTVHKTEEHVHAILKAGADGYVLKDDTSAELINAINSLLAGKTHLSPSISDKVIFGYLNDSHADKQVLTSSLDRLTIREREVLKLIAEGFRNRETAKYLSISVKTVEKHRSNMMRKLNLHNTSEITTYAIRHGLLVDSISD